MEFIPHVLQSSAWGEFRKKWGTEVCHIGKAQFTLHKVPFLPFKIGYMPRVFPQEIDWQAIAAKAKAERCIFIKVEPNSDTFEWPKEFDVRRGERMFGVATYFIDLQKTEQELLAAMHSKTRYNIGLARKKGITIKVGHSQAMFNEYLDLFHETNQRHHVVIHPDKYYQTFFDTFVKHDMLEIVTAYFEGVPLSTLILLFYEGNLYYPYGASTDRMREKMASHLAYWETIMLAKQRGCRTFDMWNCLPPEQESPDHPWWGFHRFKKGFGGEFIRFCGAYDWVFSPRLYGLMLFLNKMRWKLLKARLRLIKVIKPSKV